MGLAEDRTGERMKFYFCETCGSRLTEQDIAAGKARDKKLKGVFCQTCAVGVTTMETAPLSESQARSILAKGKDGAARPQAPAGATKFFFCEKCGERLTETDIAEGAAKDKQLKGVYCKNCSEGVLTMDFDSITEEQARQIVKDAPRNPSDAGADVAELKKRRRKRTSRHRIPAAARSGEQADDKLSRRKGLSVPIIIGSVAAVAILVAAGIVMTGEKKQSSATAKKRSTPEAKSKRAATSANQKEPATKTTDSRVQGQPDEERRVVEPDKKARPDNPIEKPPGEVRTKKEPPASPQKTPPQKKPPPEPKPDPVEQARLLALKNARAKFSDYLNAFDNAARRMVFDEASKLGIKAGADIELKPIADEAAALKDVAEVFARDVANRQKALKDGKKHAFQTKRGTTEGVVREIDGDVVSVKVVQKVDKNEIEFVKRIKLSELTAEGHARIFGRIEPTTEAEWIAMALRRIAEKKLDEAEKILPKAGTHALAARYRHLIDEIRLGKLDADAKKYWEEHLEPLLAIAKLDKKSAETGQRALSVFRKSHGKTKFAASISEKIGKLKDACESVVGLEKLTLQLGNGVRMAFLLIPAGTFKNGKSGDTVKITKPFYIAKYETTQAQYEAVMGTNPSRFKGSDLPVEMVSWKDATLFCKALSRKTNTSARLPTGSEWEYACRAGTTTLYSFGDSAADLDRYAWYDKNSELKTHPVGGKAPNKFGLHDMHGNVMEWCLNRTPDWCFARGGFWRTRASNCVSGYVSKKGDPEYASYLIGIRVVLDF